MSRKFKEACEYQREMANVDVVRDIRPVEVTVYGRADVAGGWTDTPLIPESYNSAVLNFNLDCMKLRFRLIPSSHFSLVYNGVEQHFNNPVMSAFMFLEIGFPPVKVEIISNIPKGSGLGGSGLLVASAIVAIWSCYGVDVDEAKLINYVLAIERWNMRTGGGWNDTAGTLRPYIQITETNIAHPYIYHIKEMSSPGLEQRCLLFYTGVSRLARVVLDPIINRFERNDASIFGMILEIRQDALLMWNHLVKNRYDEFGRQMADSWQRVCALESASRIPLVDEVESEIGDWVSGLKLPGAGGGGFVLAFLKDPDDRETVEGKLRNRFGSNSKIYRPKFGKALEVKYL